jgi:hypothetical protein
MRDLFNVNEGYKNLFSPDAMNFGHIDVGDQSMQKRRELLHSRVNFGGVDKRDMMSGVVDPLTIPRVECAMK